MELRREKIGQSNMEEAWAGGCHCLPKNGCGRPDRAESRSMDDAMPQALITWGRLLKQKGGYFKLGRKRLTFRVLNAVKKKS